MTDLRESRRQYFATQLDRLLADKAACEVLRDYQLNATNKTSRHIGGGDLTGSIEHPTASGKTELMFSLLDASYYRRAESSLAAPPRMFVVEPTRRLLRQTMNRLALKFPNLPVGAFYSERQDLSLPLTCITYDSFFALCEAGVITPENTDGILLDEAHRGLTDLRRGVINRFKAASLIIGYTASSDFNEVKAIYRILGKTIDSLSDKELIEAGWLCPRANIIAELNLPEDATYADRKRAFMESNVALYLGYRDDRAGNEPILGQKGLIYGWDIDHAIDIANRFNSDSRVLSALRKITGNPAVQPATVVHGGMSEKELDNSFAALKEGQTQIMVGAKIFIEGIDVPDVEWETRRAGSSRVEAIQTGGRIARWDNDNPTKTGRVFNIHVPTANTARPIFYSDVMGTPRLGRIRTSAFANRKQLPEGVETVQIPNGIKLYNAPADVESFIEKISPRVRKSGTRSLTASTMAMELSAWPQEVERIYDVLRSGYHDNEASLIEVGAHYLPRGMANEYEVNSKPVFVLREEAKSLLGDMVTPLATVSEPFMTEQDALDKLRDSGASESENRNRVKSFFTALRTEFPSRYLDNSFPLGKKSQRLTQELVFSGLSFPLHSVSIAQNDNGIEFAIHTDIISKLWHQHVPNKTASDVTLSELAGLIKVDTRNTRLRGLWEEIRQRYDTNPFPYVQIDGEKIDCGYKKTHTITAFYIDRKHAEWFKARVGKELGDKTADWLPYELFFHLLGEKFYAGTPAYLWREARSAYAKAPGEPVVIDGHIVKCGEVKIDDTAAFCFHREEREWIKAKTLDKRAEYADLREKGYISLGEAVAYLQISYPVVYLRARNIVPELGYSQDGLPAAADKAVFKGSDLIWKAHRSDTDGASVLISPMLIQAWQKALQQQLALQSNGYKTYKETAEETDLPRYIIERFALVHDSESKHTLAGRRPKNPTKITPNEIELVWRDAYSNTVLIHPLLVEARAQAEQKQRELKGQGYCLTTEVLDKVAVQVCNSLFARVKQYEPEQNYTFKIGSSAADEREVIVKGSDLYWQHPFNQKIILFHPVLVESWIESDDRYDLLREQNYRTPAETAEFMGVPKQTVMSRIFLIENEQLYSPTGIVQDDKPEVGSILVLGKNLLWRHKYSGDILLPDILVQAWKTAEEKEKQLTEAGYIPQTQLSKALDVTSGALISRLLQYDADKNPELMKKFGGQPVVWKHPYNHNIHLIHPALADAWISSKNTSDRLKQAGL